VKGGKGQLILIPVGLDMEATHTIPAYVTEQVQPLNHFIVEQAKTARRYLRRIGYKGDFDAGQMYMMGKHGEERDIDEALRLCEQGTDIGLLSEAGMPCIADPGSKVVARAHRLGIRVVPLVGPSSILLALVASGFNGQSFAFHGYLPIDKKERIQRIRQLEASAGKGQTQIFMETPFRNMQMLRALIAGLNPATRLCVAADLSMESEEVISMPVSEWKAKDVDFHKRPAIFLIAK
jgi:16S rRNA (cytidine1402-2'-O)-methyltransferase